MSICGSIIIKNCSTSEMSIDEDDSIFIIQNSDKPWYLLPCSLKEGKFPGEYKDSTWGEIQDAAINGKNH